MVVCSDADISEPDIGTDGELVEEPLDASDDDEIEKVQVSQRSKYQWTGKSFTPTPTPFHCRRSDCTSVLEPVEYFRQYFTDTLYEIIADRTKIYAGQCGYRNFSVSAIDTETVTGILLTTGITSLPEFRMHWTAGTSLDFVADLISRNRNQKHPHFDRFCNVSPLRYHIQPVCLKTEPSSGNQLMNT
ncbi:PiggyBac transposable element-derived protein 1 [Trichinella nativa]|uniref:PiggyBac transposable element-derived protein 1 n=1 Tax=Trichinella nativa TaxID=6335 RepID=A0A0V1LBI7_9BILA|nr:PiggyBac transposable element-derived protein 1 [Trichinella nativa]